MHSMFKLKKFICFIFIILFLSNINYIYASSSLKDLIYNDSHTNETSTAKSAITFESIDPLDQLARNKNNIPTMKNYDIKSAQDLQYGAPYRVVYFNLDKNNINQFKSGKKMYDILKYASYYWEFTILYKNNGSLTPVSTLQVNKGNNILVSAGRWHVGIYPAYLNPNMSYLSSQPNKINELFAKFNIKSADKFMHINMPNIGDFFYISQGSNEYFMPLQNNGEAKALNIYNRDTFAKMYTSLMENKMNVSATQSQNTAKDNSQDPYNKLKVKQPIPRFYLILIGLVFVIFGAIMNWDKIKNKYPD